MPTPLNHTWEVRRGQTIDITFMAPVDGGDPRADGSYFTLALKRSRDDADTVMFFDSRDPSRALSIEAYDQINHLVALSFRASRMTTLGITAGAYVGDLVQTRPRPTNNFGDKFDAIAAIAATVL